MHGFFIFNETSPAAPGTVASSQLVTSAANYLPGGVAGPVDEYEALDVAIDLVGATGGTLDVYVQVSPDEGANWYDVIHFPVLAAAAPAIHYQAPLSLATNTAAPAVVGKNLVPALAANVVVNGCFSDRLRLLMVAGTGTTAGAAVRATIFGQRTRAEEHGR